MRIIDENTPPLIRNKRGRNPLYPWDEWLQHGKAVMLTEGEDFHCRPSSIRQQAYNRALDKHGRLTATMARTDEGIWTVTLTFWYDDAYLAAHPELDPAMAEAQRIADETADDEIPIEPLGVTARSNYGRESIPPRPGMWGPPDEM